MSKLQELATSKISDLPDMDVKELLALIDRLCPANSSISSKK